MSTTTVRVDDGVRSVLHALAAQAGEPMSVILARAVECYRRQMIIQQANAAFAALRADPDAWRDELDERAQWDVTLADDLRDDEETEP